MASIVPASTTVLRSVGSGDTFIPLSSVSALAAISAAALKGWFIYVDQEAMPIAGVVTNSALPGVIVTRTGRAAAHGIGATVYIAPGSSFYRNDPVGVPAAGSQPYWINASAGRVWVAQGDEAGPGSANRYWQLQVTTPGTGALGVRTSSVSPT